MAFASDSPERPTAVPTRRKVLLAACLAHLTHDGFTDMLYVFFPVWQQAFALNFAQVGLMKTLFSGALALFQIPAGMLTGGKGLCRALVAGAMITSASLFVAGTTDTVFALSVLLVLGGIGASAQHPLASVAIAQAYSGKESRVALSTYNFVGDMGKLLLPALAGLLLARVSWQASIQMLSMLGVVTAVALVALLGRLPLDDRLAAKDSGSGLSRLRAAMTPAFAALNGIGILDSATRMGLLTFLPFLLRAKGADMSVLGLSLGLIFAGGCAGKLVCGIVATRVGSLKSIILTETFTAALILFLLPLPLWGALCLCPLLGVALNGTSSVLYGSVPELIPPQHRSQAFAIYYTATIGSGAVAPVLYGMLSDAVGLTPALQVTGLVILATIPLTLPLRGKLAA